MEIDSSFLDWTNFVYESSPERYSSGHGDLLEENLSQNSQPTSELNFLMQVVKSLDEFKGSHPGCAYELRRQIRIKTRPVLEPRILIEQLLFISLGITSDYFCDSASMTDARYNLSKHSSHILYYGRQQNRKLISAVSSYDTGLEGLEIISRK